MDANKLEKLFRLLGTAGDAEALAALYAIKRHVGDKKGDWHKFVNQLVAVEFGVEKQQYAESFEEVLRQAGAAAERARQRQHHEETVAEMLRKAREQRERKWRAHADEMEQVRRAAEGIKRQREQERYAKAGPDPGFADEAQRFKMGSGWQSYNAEEEEQSHYHGEVRKERFYLRDYLTNTGKWVERVSVWDEIEKQWRFVSEGPPLGDFYRTGESVFEGPHHQSQSEKAAQAFEGIQDRMKKMFGMK